MQIFLSDIWGIKEATLSQNQAILAWHHCSAR